MKPITKHIMLHDCVQYYDSALACEIVGGDKPDQDVLVHLDRNAATPGATITSTYSSDPAARFCTKESQKKNNDRSCTPATFSIFGKGTMDQKLRIAVDRRQHVVNHVEAFLRSALKPPHIISISANDYQITLYSTTNRVMAVKKDGSITIDPAYVPGKIWATDFYLSTAQRAQLKPLLKAIATTLPHR